MVVAKEHLYLMCGSPSKYVVVLAETHFCSDECRDKFYQMLDIYRKE